MKRLALIVLTLAFAAPAAGQEASSSPTVQAEVHGLILMNAFANDAAVNNSDVPQFVLPPTPAGGLPSSGAGATLSERMEPARGVLAGVAGIALTLAIGQGALPAFLAKASELVHSKSNDI